MIGWLRRRVSDAYERMLRSQLDAAPTHVAIIQDGNRRYAREQGEDAPDGHREGAKTTEQVLEWCDDLGVEELTLYAFSTENFDRPDEELEPLFDLLESKLYEFADATASTRTASGSARSATSSDCPSGSATPSTTPSRGRPSTTRSG